MALIAPETLAAIQQVVPIQEGVGAYLTLKRSGSGFKALCPFHREKTPSFHVNPSLGIFKCFGCGKAGDLIAFVREHERVSFVEAVQLLADRYGIEVQFVGGSDGPGRADLFRVLEAAMRHFRRSLLGPQGVEARKYAASRGVSDESSEKFQLGYAGPEWDVLLRHLKKAGFSEDVLRASGLFGRRDTGTLYDFLRHRLIFPIFDAQGRPIAFAGRSLDGSDPKYINTPESTLFRKGRVLYGLNLLHESREPLSALYIVEGYLDVLLPVQAGLTGFLAPMGTAFGADHARVVRRYADRVVLVFDADDAGRAASERSLDVLLEEDIDVRVASVPSGKDPADMVAAGKAQELAAALADPPEMFEYLLDVVMNRHDQKTTAGRARAIEAALERVRRVGDPVRRDLYLERLSARAGIEVPTLRARIGAPERERMPAPAAAPEETPAEAQAGEALLAILVSRPDLAPEARTRLAGTPVPGEGARAALETVFAMHDRGAAIDAASLRDSLTDESARDALSRALADWTPEDRVELALSRTLDVIRRRRTESDVKGKQESLRAASGEDADRLLREIMEAKRTRS